MGEIGFLAKKIISLMVYPLGWSLLLLMLGVLTLLFRSTRRMAVLLLTIGMLVLAVFSMEVTSYQLTKTLERQAGSFQSPSVLEKQGVKFIVVLGGSIIEEGFPPAESWGPNILRVMEGVRLAKGISDSKLVLSGGAIPGRHSVETAMSQLPEEMGVPRESLIIMTTAFDTDDEARMFSELVRDQPFGLVTSARHMPRSIKLFRQYGANPVACPCDFKTLQEMIEFSKYMPNPGNLLDSHMAIHEYIGMFWIDIKKILSAN